MSKIKVTREHAPWRDRARGYKVLIDGRQAGSLRQGDAATYTVEPGNHTVQMKIDWCTSRRLPVEVPADGTAQVTCRPGHNSWTALFDCILRGAFLHRYRACAGEEDDERLRRRAETSGRYPSASSNPWMRRSCRQPLPPVSSFASTIAPLPSLGRKNIRVDTPRVSPCVSQRRLPAHRDPVPDEPLPRDDVWHLGPADLLHGRALKNPRVATPSVRDEHREEPRERVRARAKLAVRVVG